MFNPEQRRLGGPAASCEYSEFSSKRMLICSTWFHKQNYSLTGLRMRFKHLHMESKIRIYCLETSLTPCLCSKEASVKGTYRGTLIKGRKTDFIQTAAVGETVSSINCVQLSPRRVRISSKKNMTLWGEQRGNKRGLFGKDKGEQSLAELHFLEQKLNTGARVTWRNIDQCRWKPG